MRNCTLGLIAPLLFVLSAAGHAAETTAAALTKLPIREVTVFKDGHALLLREGQCPVDSRGAVVLNEMPAPELGTFFPFSSQQDAPLTSVLATHETVKGQREDVEKANVPQSMKWNNYDYGRSDQEGSVDVTSHETQPVTLEITRHVFGKVDTAGDNGQLTALNAIDADGPTVSNSYSSWWDHFNGYGRIDWKVKVAPGEKKCLKYNWHCYYR